jgi:hypothetical protein
MENKESSEATREHTNNYVREHTAPEGWTQSPADLLGWLVELRKA